MSRLPTAKASSTGPAPLAAVGSPKTGTLHSWKEIAAHLRHGVRTVQRWEESEGLPVHRHAHAKRDSVYAYAAELDAWWISHQAMLEQADKPEAILPEELPAGRKKAPLRLFLLISGAILVVLLVAAGVWLRWGIPRLGTRALSFAPRDWVLVTDFDNQTGETVFDRSLLTAFTVSLEQSTHANVFPRTRVAVTLQRMGRNLEIRINEQIGREICLREHIRGLISCSITRTGRQYALAAHLIDPLTGAAVRSYFEPVSNQDQIIATLGKITAAIRRDLGESLASIRQNDDPLPQVTTSSLDALRLYSEGNYLWRRGQYEPARMAYQSALERDPNFAMAYVALGTVYMSHIYNSPLKGKEHYEKALQHADRITDRERLFIQASHQDSLGHPDEAVRNYRVYLNAYPDDTNARFDLGRLLMGNHRAQEAESELQAVLRLDPGNARAWIGLANTHNELGRSSEALMGYSKAFELEPTWVTLGNLNHEYGFTLVQTGNIPKAREVFALALAKRDMEDHALRSLALLDMYEGKYRDAQGRLERAILLSSTNPAPISRARHHLYMAILLEGRGDRRGQLRELDRASDDLANWPDPQVWLMARIGAAYARAGAVAKAGRILQRLAPQADRANPSDTADLHILEGELALAGNDYPRAADRLQLGAQSIPLPLGLAGLARAYRAANDTERAIPCYEQLIGLGWRVLGWEPQQAWISAHAELAEAYMSRGERDKAGRTLNELARLWKDADPELPLTKRLARLQKQVQNNEHL
ncbi:MAG TPA: tetratricopeptide repeat protein [Acidobacteriota bacterium]|nr:tetratricopeptide repeat protein [Acidobacteriota bacterium]